MKKIKYLIRNHFGFSQRETKGFIFLIILILLLLFTPLLFDLLYTPAYAETKADSKILDSLIREVSIKETEIEATNSNDHIKLSYSYFDPNTAGEDALAAIVGKKIAGTILRFRSKGGRFKSKNDLKKIYGMSEAMYVQITPYILLPDSAFSNKKFNKEKVSIKLDINKADTSELIKLKGIGSVLATRIIKFRDKLGGFISTEQYLEIYGLSDIVLKELKENTFISSGFIPQKIFVNQVNVESMAGHPYIGKKNAQLIVNYRNNHGAFHAAVDLIKIVAIEKDKLDKMLPYLSF